MGSKILPRVEELFFGVEDFGFEVGVGNDGGDAGGVFVSNNEEVDEDDKDDEDERSFAWRAFSFIISCSLRIASRSLGFVGCLYSMKCCGFLL